MMWVDTQPWYEDIFENWLVASGLKERNYGEIQFYLDKFHFQDELLGSL